MKLDKSAAAWAVAALAILVAGALGLYGLTPVADRPTILHAVSGPIGQFVTLGIMAAGAWVTAYKARATHAETAAQTPVLANIQAKVNGELDARLQAQSDATVQRVGDLIDSRLNAATAGAVLAPALAPAIAPAVTGAPEAG